MSTDVGEALVLLSASLEKHGGTPEVSYGMSGKLYLSQSGWLLLHVPNDLVHGAFAALHEPGIELPPSGPAGDRMNAHISVIRPEELEAVGLTGADVKERGKQFHYTLGPVQSTVPAGWADMSRVWFIKVLSPELKQLRKTYGLTPLPNNDKFDFHITIAVRRKHVLGANEVRKAASLIHSGPQQWFEQLLEKQGEDPALGIPDRGDLGDLSKLSPGLIDLVIQNHRAARAGQHFDVRFGTPDTGLFSWATKHELPEPGQRRALFRQPLHRHSYGDFEGQIGEGYGQGSVTTHRRGKILVTGMDEDKIEFTTADKKHPERFVLLRPQKWGQKDWLLVNRTPTQGLPYEKVHYRKIPGDKIEKAIAGMRPGETLERKLDGASSLVHLLENGAELLSYRTSRTTGRPIVHTERFFGGPGKMKIPPELVGTVLKGELYGVRRGGRGETAGGDRGVPARDGDEVQIGPQDLGGILNASVANSLQVQKEKGVTLRNMLYDIQQLGKTPIDWHQTPRMERRKMIEQVLQHLPANKFHISQAATTPEEGQALWNEIKSTGYSPSTEGVVYWPLHGTPYKSKLVEDQDVYLTGTFPGAGKLQDAGIGGFTYALEPGGKTVGRIGTGLSDELRQNAFTDPDSFVGRVARIRSQNQYPSGAWRTPALLGLHEDYPNVKEAMAPRETELEGDLYSAHFSREWAALHRREAVGSGGRDKSAALRSGAEGVLPGPGSGDGVGVPVSIDGGPGADADLAEPDRSYPLSVLLQAKVRSDARDYRQKYQLIRQLMQQDPRAFVVDSPVGKYHGVTHVPTGFKFHLPPVVFQDLIKESSLGYAVRRSAIHGKGTFATRTYKPGDRIGLALQLSRKHDDDDTQEFDRTVLGRFVNYQPQGNAGLVADEHGNLYLQALEEIPADHEIYTQPYEDELKQFGKLTINGGYKQAFDLSGSWYGTAAQDYLNNMLAGRGQLWNPSAGVWGNVTQHLGNIRDIASNRIRQAGNLDRLRAAMDPDYSLRRFSAVIGGQARPLIQHPVDAILHGRFGS